MVSLLCLFMQKRFVRQITHFEFLNYNNDNECNWKKV